MSALRREVVTVFFAVGDDEMEEHAFVADLDPSRGVLGLFAVNGVRIQAQCGVTGEVCGFERGATNRPSESCCAECRQLIEEAFACC